VAATLSVTSQSATLLSTITYDAPVVTQSVAPNVALTVSSVTTLVGTNFGDQDFTPSAAFGSTPSMTVTWTTFSSVAVQAAAVGFGNSFDILVTIQAIVGTTLKGFL